MPPSLSQIDLCDLADHERSVAVQANIDTEMARPFDLGAGPLLRAVLLRTGEREHLFLVSVHHAVFDGWSFDIFMSELCALYGDVIAGTQASRSRPLLHYADAAVWERERLQGDALRRLTAYWAGRL